MNAPAVEVRDIPGYEGLYAVASDGRVWGYERRWTTGNHSNGRLHRAARWLRLIQQNTGYLVVNLKSGGRAKTALVHRLVALTWIPNPLGLPNVNHLNFDRTDNRVANLEWCTPGENSRHSVRAVRARGVFVRMPRDIACANDSGRVA